MAKQRCGLNVATTDHHSQWKPYICVRDSQIVCAQKLPMVELKSSQMKNSSVIEEDISDKALNLTFDVFIKLAMSVCSNLYTFVSSSKILAFSFLGGWTIKDANWKSWKSLLIYATHRIWFIGTKTLYPLAGWVWYGGFY